MKTAPAGALPEHKPVAIARLQSQRRRLRLVDHQSTGLAAAVAGGRPRRQGLLFIAQRVADRDSAVVLDHKADFRDLGPTKQLHGDEFRCPSAARATPTPMSVAFFSSILSRCPGDVFQPSTTSRASWGPQIPGYPRYRPNFLRHQAVTIALRLRPLVRPSPICLVRKLAGFAQIGRNARAAAVSAAFGFRPASLCSWRKAFVISMMATSVWQVGNHGHHEFPGKGANLRRHWHHTWARTRASPEPAAILG